MEAIEVRKGVSRVRHELRRREVEVVGVERLGAEFVRVVFGGEALDGFVSLGFDDHVKFMVEGVGGREPVRRDYTPRRFDAGRRELTIDFALHGEGLASDWARRAAVGDAATIGGPRGSMIVSPDFDWHLFVADATGAPAIGRRLEELPAGRRAIVIVQLADLAALELARSAAQIELQQVESAEALVAAVAGQPLPAGDGYAWGAGEAASMTALRDLLLGEKRHPREAMRVAAYWKRGASDHHEELARAG